MLRYIINLDSIILKEIIKCSCKSTCEIFHINISEMSLYKSECNIFVIIIYKNKMTSETEFHIDKNFILIINIITSGYF